jgi:toxin ParE1/3/4
MAEYQFSRRAALDLEAIAEYTIERFGLGQAQSYRDDLGACFERLADNPRLGRPARELGPELRRYEHRSHIIFYQKLDTGILIVRVLHYRMELTRQAW